MKAEFSKYGVLQITPENETENYALDKWNQSFARNFTVECESVIHINTYNRCYGIVQCQLHEPD